MFDITSVQAIINGLFTNLSLMIFIALGAVLGILAALIGISIGIHSLVKYVAKGGAKEMQVGWWGDKVKWEGKDPLSGTGLGEEDIEKQRTRAGEHFNPKTRYWYDN
jgi:hypothetical protein